MTHTNESIRELVNRANDKGWKDSELNQLVIEADVSEVTDMSELFYNMKNFNLDISNWNVSSCANMRYMFAEAYNFNQDIGAWDVSKVSDMNHMFIWAKNFNQNIGSWNVSSVTDISFMFYETTEFNQDISNWDISSVGDMGGMFREAKSFNQDISSWDISNVTNMSQLFKDVVNFNQDLTIWQALNDDLDSTVFLRSASLIKYCGDLSSDYIDSYLFKKELELKEQLTKTGRLGLKKDLQNIDSSSIQVSQYRLLSNFKALKDRLQATDPQTINTKAI
jgi:surface protein